MLVILPLGAASVALVLVHLRRRGALTLPRVLGGALACVYLAGIVANTLLPIYLGRPDYGVPWHAYLNLRPLTNTSAADMVQNVVVFMPLGILLSLLAGVRSIRRVVLWGFTLSFVMEAAQFLNAVTGHGGHVADVNDLLANVLGAPLGYGVFLLALRLPAARRLADALAWPPAGDDVDEIHVGPHLR